ncbi:MAG: hypothetical protein RR324_09920 [Cellulosilyticaceae bacterium]|uniref:hypothetical protein n=1 Tax=Niameybacter sp. TaxID=2033640 RepID=UPI002FC98631
MTLNEMYKALRCEENSYTQYGKDRLIILDIITNKIIEAIGLDLAKELVDMLDTGWDSEVMLMLDYKVNRKEG